MSNKKTDLCAYCSAGKHEGEPCSYVCVDSIETLAMNFNVPGNVLWDLILAAAHAHKEHPIFIPSGEVSEGVYALGEEFGEICKALYEKNPKQAMVECDQTAQTAIRLKMAIQEKNQRGSVGLEHILPCWSVAHESS